MKEAKICIIALIITCFIIISTAFALPASAEENPEFYPKLAIIFQIEKTENEWIIFCKDKSQNVWTFYDDEEEWQIGDIINLLMWNWNNIETDNELIEVYKEGHTDNFTFFFENMGWR